ncbi:hypothetical protein [Gloeothece verrucosa]|uniref:Uncharacterized protein n=1 Tax=Gloeothece verrucosa (strain PCC 7822) TaxID=497965 RepID=E0U7T9_GLOV7|nr:hypothetical protein [Gloeothece verrucosa]ADN14583.1 hypothetical protein Cyan7822_2612 [Gloeothece verrucosa PCC 7822]ADN14901.1 hypothetical protein Cyan7822_2944 [Gloeothece verrucosa PCC 7822]ADN15216.1 hypothetical protein Cyan7822_3266 [Gloeothece verrucosa PCC 7822]
MIIISVDERWTTVRKFTKEEISKILQSLPKDFDISIKNRLLQVINS